MSLSSPFCSFPTSPSPITPRFNIHQPSSRTFNPSNPILSFSYLNSEKALTTPEHLHTLPSSTTSFGRMKSDKSIRYQADENKENLRSMGGQLGSSEMKEAKNVNEIEAEFRKIIEEFESRKVELEKNFSSPFEVEKYKASNSNLSPNTPYPSPFTSSNNSSCYMIKEITDECTSTAEDFNSEQPTFIPSLISQDHN